MLTDQCPRCVESFADDTPLLVPLQFHVDKITEEATLLVACPRCGRTYVIAFHLLRWLKQVVPFVTK
jgi:ribosomal protein S27AE